METEAILARCSVLGVRGSDSAFMIALPVWLACVQAPHEVGDQVRELRLLALGKLRKARQRN
jgi:hypothetical protein